MDWVRGQSLARYTIFGREFVNAMLVVGIFDIIPIPNFKKVRNK